MFSFQEFNKVLMNHSAHQTTCRYRALQRSGTKPRRMRRCRAGRYAMILGVSKEGFNQRVSPEFSGREPKKLSFLGSKCFQHFVFSETPAILFRFGRSFDIKKSQQQKLETGYSLNHHFFEANPPGRQVTPPPGIS